MISIYLTARYDLSCGRCIFPVLRSESGEYAVTDDGRSFRSV